jgi:nucleotide-binding universal stress UspA family protein
MFKTILIASDLSEASDAVINRISELRPFGVQAVVLFYALGIRFLQGFNYRLEESVEPTLVKQKEALGALGFHATVVIRPGIPGEELHSVVAEENVSLIVLASHAECMVNHLLFHRGGASPEVLHSHEKPVLLLPTRLSGVNREGNATIPERDIRGNILFATDFSDAAQRAFDYLQGMVEEGSTRLTLLHVQNDDALRTETAEQLAALKERLIAKGAEHVKMEIPYGDPAQTILDHVKEGYTMIVMGSRGRGLIKGLFLGSVSDTIVRCVEIPILLVPSARPT